MTLNRLGRGLAAVSLTLAALALGACGSDIAGRAVPESGGSAADTLLPDEPETDTGGTVDIDNEIGECVELTGSVSDATVAKAPCGRAPANYKVIGKAPTNAQCVSDADSYYYETLMGDEQGALCLDIDCASPAREGVRVAEIITGVTDVEKCSTPSGYVYEVRCLHGRPVAAETDDDHAAEHRPPSLPGTASTTRHYSQSRRLKIVYRVIHVNTIISSAIG